MRDAKSNPDKHIPVRADMTDDEFDAWLRRVFDAGRAQLSDYLGKDFLERRLKRIHREVGR